MPVYRDEAVVLRTHKLGEADRIVTLLTRRHGKVRAVAKGVRRTGSKFGARLEPFMVADLQLYEGRTLDVVHAGRVARLVRRRDHAGLRVATPRRTPWSRPPTSSPRPRGRCSSTCCWSARSARSPSASTARASPSTPTCCARWPSPAGRRASRTARAAARRARTPPWSCSSAAWSATTAPRPARPASPGPPSPCSARCSRATGRSPSRRASPTATRRAASSPPTPSGTSSAACARCRTSRRETTAT